MTNKIMATIFVLISSVSYAQRSDYDVESVETNNIYNDTEAASDIRDPNLVRGSNEAVDTANSPQINIYNANSNANKQAQKSHAQTDSAVESSSVSDVNSEVGNDYIARANEIRRARKDMEIGTEQKMIEKIEWSRIEDEKDRNDRLFGNRLDKKYDNSNPYGDNYDSKKEVVVVEKPVYQQVSPVPAPVYKEEIKVVEDTSYSLLSDSKSYIAPTIGWMSHPSAVNVDSATTFGVSMGTLMSSGVSVEGGISYASFTMEDYDVVTFLGQPGQKEVSQYGLNAAVKYNFSAGRISPNIGALLGYSYRDYTETRALSEGTTSSSAVDAGVSAGVDFRISSAFSLGVEYRIMKNIWNDREDNNNTVSSLYSPYALTQNREKLEEVGYQQFGVNAKFNF